VDFADAQDRHLLFRQHVHQHGLRWIHRVIVATRSSFEISRRSFEWSCDHPADTVFSVEKLPRNFAHAIKLWNRDYAFMCGDLKYAVARGVHDREAGPYMLFTQFLDDLRAGSGFVAECFVANLFFKSVHDFRRESMFVNGESLIQPDTSHFPVPGGSVLSWRVCGSFPKGGLRRSVRSKVL